MTPQAVPLNVTGGGAIALAVEDEQRVTLAMERVRMIYNERPAYTGQYTVTPGATAQTLATNGKRMTADVVVGAIPENYGLVTWNGSILKIT